MSDKLRFGEILVRAGVLERTALESVAREWEAAGGDLGELLVRRGVVDETAMLQTIGKSLNLPTVGLDGVEVDPRALERIPRALCEEHVLVPLEVERSKTGEHLHVAMANPADIRAIKVVTREARLRIRPLVASAREIRAAIRRFYGGDDPSAILATAAMEVVRPTTPFGAPAESVPAAPPPAGLRRPPPPPPPTPGPPPSVAPSPVAEALFDFGVMDLSADAPPGMAAPAPAKVPDLDDVLEMGLGQDPITTSDLGSGGFAPLGAPRRPEPPPALVTRAPAPESPPREAPPGMPGRGLPAIEARRSAPIPPLPGRPPGLAARVDSQPSAGRPLPPLPPNLRAAPPAVQAPRPPTGPSPELSPPPLPPPMRSAPARPPEPEGLVEDREPLDVRRILDRYHEEIAESDEPDDEIIARHLERYGKERGRQSPDAFFEALDAALSRAKPGTGLLVTALIRHLARRGLVDLRELLAELQGE